MSRFMTFAALLVSVVVLSVVLFFTVRVNKNLVKTKEFLILQNDSLHMLQLKTRKEMASMKTYLDSMLPKTTNKLIILK